MKKFLFVVSHLGAGHVEFIEAMNQHPRIQLVPTDTVYRTPMDLQPILQTRHKLDNAAAIYGDRLLFNYSFCCPALFKMCQFVYLLRPAVPSLAGIAQAYGDKRAFLHYSFRLRRLCEMAAKTPGAVLLTQGEVEEGRGMEVVAKYLGLPHAPPTPTPAPTYKRDFPAPYRKKAEECYERHLYFLRSLNLVRA
jgi:hypothetical protein